MYNRQVWEATPDDTPVHRLDVRTKLMLLAAMPLMATGCDKSVEKSTTTTVTQTPEGNQIESTL